MNYDKNYEGGNFGFKFRDWDIYKDARKIRIEIYELIKKFPKEELYALTDQTKRASSSVVLNIAESANKNTDKDRRVYINRAHCSVDEVAACLDCALDNEYITENENKIFSEKLSSLAKRLHRFNNYLNRS